LIRSPKLWMAAITPISSAVPVTASKYIFRAAEGRQAEIPQPPPLFHSSGTAWAGSMAGSLAFALCTVLLWIFLFILLYRHKVYIKI